MNEEIYEGITYITMSKQELADLVRNRPYNRFSRVENPAWTVPEQKKWGDRWNRLFEVQPGKYYAIG